VPTLAGAQEGFVWGIVSEINGRECVFPSLSITDVEAVDGAESFDFDDGDYELRFYFIAMTSQQEDLDDPPLAASQIDRDTPVWSTELMFTSRQALLKVMKDRQLKLAPLIEQRNRYNEALAQFTEIQLQLQAIVDSPRTSFEVKEIMFAKDATSTQLELLQECLDRRVKDLKCRSLRSSQLRLAKKLPDVPNPLVVSGKPSVGLVVDLAFVDNLVEARILSWAAGTYIDALVVDTSAVSTELYKKGVKVWALDQIVPFKVRDAASNGDRPRNAEELAKKALPLEEPHMGFNADRSRVRPSGNPRYMVNLIQLNSEYEHLRDSVFFAVFGRSLLFDDMESASEYRTFLVRKGAYPPPIFSLSGEKFLSQGVLDPKAGKIPKELQFVFGEQDPTRSADYHTLQLEADMVQDLLQLVAQRATVKEVLESCDINQLDLRIRECRKGDPNSNAFLSQS